VKASISPVTSNVVILSESCRSLMDMFIGFNLRY
jgi:hypothetical protein